MRTEEKITKIKTYNLRGMTDEQLAVVKACIMFAKRYPDDMEEFMEKMFPKMDFDWDEVLYSIKPNTW